MVLVTLLALAKTITASIPRLELSPSRNPSNLVRQWAKKGENDLCIHIYIYIYIYKCVCVCTLEILT